MAERVPFIDLGAWVQKVRGEFTKNYIHEFDSEIGDLLTSHEFLGGGPTTKKLEAKLATKLGAEHVVTCANGTDALQLALRACGIDHGHRVAIPNVTFWATYEAIVNVGATPVLIDIDPDDRQMSFDEFKRAHDQRRFDAAILVHLYGWASGRLAEFRSFCRERHITLIEDGAQAFGVETVKGPEFLDVNKQSIFADADVATLSFHPAKVLGGIGDGGAVVCKTSRMAARVRALANHGRSRDGQYGQHEHVAPGWNSRLDAIQAAWLLRALDIVDEVIEARRTLLGLYAAALRLESVDVKSTWPPSILTNGYMTAFTTARPAAEIIERLSAQGIEARRIYPYTIADQAHGAIEFGPLLNSRKLIDHIVSLPLYYGMSGGVVTRCVKAYVEAAR